MERWRDTVPSLLELLRQASVTMKVTWAGQRMTKNMAIKAVAARVAKSVARM
jgi:hypothetical protein